jgi:small subunit ribosomal protein S17e
MQVLERYRDRFTTNYAENKKTLDQVAVIRSKALKNEMAGFITKFIKREQNSKPPTEANIEQVEDEQAIEKEQTIEESVPQEIVVENTTEESN